MDKVFLRRGAIMGMIPQKGGGRIGTQEILDRLESLGFEGNLRTVQRDLLDLEEQGLINGDGSRPQGWQLQGDAPGLLVGWVQPQAAMALRLLQDYLSPLIPPGIMRTLAPVFDKADEVIKANQRHGMAEWLRRVRVVPSGFRLQVPEIPASVQTATTRALMEQRQLQIRYRSLQGEAKIYPVHPLGLVLKGDILYLVATARHYKRPAIWAVNRILKADVLEDEPANTPEDFDLDAFVTRQGLAFSRQQEIRLVLKTNTTLGRLLLERPLSADQTWKADGEDFRFTATVPLSEDLVSWILGHRANLEVVSPAGLRREIRGHLEAALALYQSSP